MSNLISQPCRKWSAVHHDTSVEANARGWASETHAASDGRWVVTVTHPGLADWRNPAADPTPLVRAALGRPQLHTRITRKLRERSVANPLQETSLCHICQLNPAIILIDRCTVRPRVFSFLQFAKQFASVRRTQALNCLPHRNPLSILVFARRPLLHFVSS